MIANIHHPPRIVRGNILNCYCPAVTHLTRAASLGLLALAWPGLVFKCGFQL